MKNKISKILVFSILSLAILLSFSRSVLAEEIAKEKPTEVQISKIVAECSNIKKHLSKLHSADALNRVNLGQNYESISNNLMAKLNARISLNRMNSANLVSKTVELDENIQYFRENYKKFETELKKLQKIDCSKSSNAQEFYLQLEKTRHQRSELNYNVSKIKEIIKEYKALFEEFRKGVK
ncbi:MAG: hypothetical protein WAV68_01490 [Candidatus Nanogingivalis sp.]